MHRRLTLLNLDIKQLLILTARNYFIFGESSIGFLKFYYNQLYCLNALCVTSFRNVGAKERMKHTITDISDSCLLAYLYRKCSYYVFQLFVTQIRFYFYQYSFLHRLCISSCFTCASDS